MKLFRSVMKVLAALAAVAGVIYVVATYGDKIVAWAKKLLSKFSCCDCCCDDECCCGEDDCCCGEEDCCCSEDDCCCEEEACCCEEAPAEETVQAEEADFEA